MCTVTFIARKNGFALGMNRDEKLSRVRALPPAVRQIGGMQAVFPSEPQGGTWIGVNEAGICFALINWYSAPTQLEYASISRGIVVTSLLSSRNVADAEEILRALNLRQINPFRVIGFFPAAAEIREWRWDLDELRSIGHAWEASTWISSGFDEPGAQISRTKAFVHALNEPAPGSVRWLRRLHGSHDPERSAYSTCMHRDDAATVSYTEIVVSSGVATMNYHPASLCCGGTWSTKDVRVSIMPHHQFRC